jgi:trimethylamine--corrinoid protein Co-methyltransferase
MAVSPISPLTFPGEIVDAILAISRNGIPFGPLPCPSLGSTAPLSLAGALAQQNAENLAAITLAQLTNPGLPVIYCGRIAASNLSTLSPAWGNPETGIVSAATVQIGHHYGLPVNVYGLSCSTYTLDIQNGYERMLNALLPALAGVDELSGIGEMAGGVCSCPAQMVIDNDIVDMLRRVQRGFQVDRDSLGIDVIGRVMDGARNYLAEQHTVKYIRQGEVWRSQLAVQPVSWDTWRARGETVAQKAQVLANRLLKEHSVAPLPKDQVQSLDELLQAVIEKRW